MMNNDYILIFNHIKLHSIQCKCNSGSCGFIGTPPIIKSGSILAAASGVLAYPKFTILNEKLIFDYFIHLQVRSKLYLDLQLDFYSTNMVNLGIPEQ